MLILKYSALVLVTIFALIIRVSYIESTVIDDPIRADAKKYTIYGYNLLTKGIFTTQLNSDSKPDSFCGPGFPFMVALSMKLTDPNDKFIDFILYTHAFMGAAVTGLAMIISFSFLSFPAVLAVGILTALSPHLITSGGYVLTETSFSFFQLSALVLFFIALQKRRLWLFSLAGCFFGYAYLINPVIFFYPFILSVLSMAQSFRENKGFKEYKLFKGIMLFLLCFTVFWGGWGARSMLNVSPDSQSSQDRALLNLIIGSHPDYAKEWQPYTIRKGMGIKLNLPRSLQVTADEFEQSQGSFLKFATMFCQRFGQSPLEYLSWYLVSKPYLLYSWDILIGSDDIYIYPAIKSYFRDNVFGRVIRSAMKASHPFVLFLAMTGLVLLVIRITKGRMDFTSPMILIYVLLLYISAVYVVFQSEPRYSIPFRPQLYISAVWAATLIIEWISLIVWKKFGKDR